MTIWTKDEEAKELRKRFDALKRSTGMSRAAFARQYGLKGGDALIYQHITGHRPMSIDAAIIYSKGFGCELHEISPRLAAEVSQMAIAVRAKESAEADSPHTIALDGNSSSQGLTKGRKKDSHLMFGSNKKLADLEQSIRDYQAALQRIAQHVGVAQEMQPDQLATAICRGIDALVGKEPLMASTQGSENRSIPANIHKIKLNGAADVVVRQGTEPRMEVFANDAKDLPKIFTTVSGDCLTVDNESLLIVSSGHGISQITTGNRGYITQCGSILVGSNIGAVIGKRNGNEQRTTSLGFRVDVTLPNVAALRISGTGNVTYRDIDQDELRLDVSGAGNIEVTGKVNRLEADVSGAGDIAAYSLSATHGRLRVSGAGNIKATATESVVARVSGVGTIKIGGNPPQRDTDVSGIGTIKFVDSRNA